VVFPFANGVDDEESVLSIRSWSVLFTHYMLSETVSAVL
jgi:hypothetical protein